MQEPRPTMPMATFCFIAKSRRRGRDLGDVEVSHYREGCDEDCDYDLDGVVCEIRDGKTTVTIPTRTGHWFSAVYRPTGEERQAESERHFGGHHYTVQFRFVVLNGYKEGEEINWDD